MCINTKAGIPVIQKLYPHNALKNTHEIRRIRKGMVIHMISELKTLQEIGSIPLAILESVIASKIYSRQDRKRVSAFLDEFDESIITQLENELKEPYEREQVQDFIAQTNLSPNYHYAFITDNAKAAFIDQFFAKHPDLQYIGKDKITACLGQYIDKTNDILNKILSEEGKILYRQINASEHSLKTEIQNAKQEIVSDMKDIKESLSTLSNRPLPDHNALEGTNGSFPANVGKGSTSRPLSYNVGVKNRLFFGRSHEIDMILSKLQKGEFVFLTGAGGMGKSQIAQETVLRLQDKYGLILWFPADTETMLLNEFNNAAISFHLITDRTEDFNLLKSRLASFIETFPDSLIIYDGADDISIEFLSEKCIFPTADIMVTTQNSNIDPDEFSVIPIDSFTPDEACGFLMSRSNMRKKTDEDAEVIPALCNLLENYPLALEYARSYVNKTRNSFAEYLHIYEGHRHDILKKPLSKYKKTAYTAWKISYDKVVGQSADAKDVLNILSFTDTYDIPLRDIFVSSLQYSLDRLNSAVLTVKAYSLLATELDADNEFAYMHGITQEFIRLQMQEEHEYRAYYNKALQSFSRLMPKKITNASERNLANRMSKHAVKLLSHKCGCDDDETIQEIIHFAENTASNLYALGRYQQTIEFIQGQLETYPSEQDFKLLHLVTFLAQACHYTGKDENALCVLEKYCSVVSSSEKLTDMQKCFLLSRYKNAEGIIQKDQGKYDLSLASYLEALKYNEVLDPDCDKETRCNLLNNIGIVYKHLGQYEQALMYYNQALSCSYGEKHLLLRIYGNIATACRILREYDDAVENYLKSYDYSVELGDKRNECTCLGNIGICYMELHQYDEAADSIKKSLEIANEVNFMIGAINAYYNLGVLAYYQKDYTEAKKCWELSLKKSQNINYQQGTSNAINALRALQNPILS